MGLHHLNIHRAFQKSNSCSISQQQSCQNILKCDQRIYFYNFKICPINWHSMEQTILLSEENKFCSTTSAFEVVELNNHLLYSTTAFRIKIQRSSLLYENPTQFFFACNLIIIIENIQNLGIIDDKRLINL